MRTRTRSACIVSLAMTSGVSIAPAQNQAGESATRLSLRPLRIVEPGPNQRLTAPHSDHDIDVAWRTTWRPICGSPRVPFETFATIVDQLQQEPDADDTTGTDVRGTTGLNINFTTNGQVPSASSPAITAAELYIETQFDDMITVPIRLRFRRLGNGGLLGVTSVTSAAVPYADVRTALVNGMDFDDELQSALPPGATLPVRFDGTLPDVTPVASILVTRANLNAAIAPASGSAATITFNSSVAWDFDPADGVSGISFIDVLIHETAHALGFQTGIGGEAGEVWMQDLFRFPLDDGTTDDNPDDLARFETAPRLVALDTPDDGHIFDLIDVELRMADGLPNEASHFREESPAIGLMDPVLGSGETFGPSYYRAPDIGVLDALGYDAGLEPPGTIELRLVASDGQATSADTGPLKVSAGQGIDLYVQARINDDLRATGLLTFDGILTDDLTGSITPTLLTVREATGLDFPGDDADGRTGMFPTYRVAIGSNNDDLGNGQLVDDQFFFLPLNLSPSGNGEGLAGEFSTVYKFTWSSPDLTERIAQINVVANGGAYQSTVGLRDTSDVITDSIEIEVVQSCVCEFDAMAPVDIRDLLAFLEVWFPTSGQTVVPGSGADVNQSGSVDTLDLLDFLSCWFVAEPDAGCQ